METISQRLKAFRQKKKLRQKDISDLIGVPVATISNWEQGRREPGGLALKYLNKLLATAEKD